MTLDDREGEYLWDPSQQFLCGQWLCTYASLLNGRNLRNTVILEHTNDIVVQVKGQVEKTIPGPDASAKSRQKKLEPTCQKSIWSLECTSFSVLWGKKQRELKKIFARTNLHLNPCKHHTSNSLIEFAFQEIGFIRLAFKFWEFLRSL